jgi:predicted amidohydrolase YtcJ
MKGMPKRRRCRPNHALAPLLLLLAACGAGDRGDADAQNPTGVDLVVVNADVRTADPARPRAEAFAVHEGKFVAVGEATAVAALAGPATRRIDAGGATILPGLIDGHTHMVGGGDLTTGVDLFDIPDKVTWLAKVAERVATLAPGEWLLGGRWDHTMAEGEYPTREDLDRVSPRNPVALRDIDGHSAWVNSLALELAGITADTVVPDGGVIVLDPRTAEPTGILKESATALLGRAAGYAEARAASRDALLDTLRHANSLGITGIHEMSSLEVLDRYRGLAEAGQLPIRVWFGVVGVEDAATADRVAGLRGDYAITSAESGPLLALGYLKQSIDGVLSTHTAALLQPYSDRPDTLGTPFHAQERLNELVRLGAERGLPVAVHAIGDRGVQMALDAFEATGGAGLAHRIEHVEIVQPEDVARFKALGVIASMQPNHGTGVIGKYITERVGEREVNAYVWGDLARAGVPLVLGSDWPTAPLAPLTQLADAVLRESPYGLYDGPWYPQQALTFDTALHGYTQAGADATAWAAEIGSITPGKWADFVRLDGRLAAEPARDLKDRTVVETWLAGRQVFPLLP